MFAGRVADVHADALSLVADPAAPRWSVAMGVCCAALIDSYAGDAAAARRWLDDYAADAGRRGRRTGFVPFTRGELAAAADPEAALAWFDVSTADERRGSTRRTSATSPGSPAPSVLIRLRRRAEAVSCLPRRDRSGPGGRHDRPGLDLAAARPPSCSATSATPQAAAAILAAADADPLAPVVLGPDLERQARLRRAGRPAAGLPATAPRSPRSPSPSCADTADKRRASVRGKRPPAHRCRHDRHTEHRVHRRGQGPGLRRPAPHRFRRRREHRHDRGGRPPRPVPGDDRRRAGNRGEARRRPPACIPGWSPNGCASRRPPGT